MVVLSASKFVISLEDVYPAGKYVVKAVSPVYEYLNGKRTDTIIGYRYTLIDTSVYEIFDVKIESKNPIVTPEVLRDGDQIWVALDGAIIKPYELKGFTEKCSIKADAIRILKE